MKLHSQVTAITNSSSEAYVAPPFAGGDVEEIVLEEAARLIEAGDEDVLEFCGGDRVFKSIGQETRDEQDRIVDVEWVKVPEVDREELRDALQEHMLIDTAKNGIVFFSNMDDWRFPTALSAFIVNTFGAAHVET